MTSSTYTETAIQPVVSVIMAVFNCASTLPNALKSIEEQTFSNWELVVCDDASDDDSLAVLEEFAQRYPDRVTLLRNEVNLKLPISLNRCLQRVRGEYVARMDGDDLSMPERFERQVGYLRAHPEVDLVGTAMRRFDETGLADIVELAPRPDRYSMRTGVPFAHATIMARRKVYELLGGYSTSPRVVRVEDKDLWFRFLDAGLVGHNLVEPLYLVREDISAIRRRTLRNRLNLMQTTLAGYRLLRYPLWWYAIPLGEFLKVLVPARAILAYRRTQARQASRGDDPC